ncbi:MAG: purine-binding chemotaxis protein CheW [Nitrospira sp.]|nr:purine-binding chemotaxis protein CheW [Nitrospira sp.]
MSTLINEIDARTRLAGANQMELLLFKLGTNEIFGINVFKVREVMKLPELTQIPEADTRIVGMANIRGIMVPVVGLKRALGLGMESGGQAEGQPGTNPYLIVSEYNGSLQGFLVAGVDRIIRFSWSAIKTPPAIVRENNKGAVTAVTMLEDGRMVLILDVEKVLNDICPRSTMRFSPGWWPPLGLKSKCIVRRRFFRGADADPQGVGAPRDVLHHGHYRGEAWPNCRPLARSGNRGRQGTGGSDPMHSQRH